MLTSFSFRPPPLSTIPDRLSNVLDEIGMPSARQKAFRGALLETGYGAPWIVVEMLDEFVKAIDFSTTFRVNKSNAQTLFHVAGNRHVFFLPNKQPDEG
jgi:hypothetical protein